MDANEEADAIAFYIWPPRWVGAAPQDESGRELADVIFESSLPDSPALKVCRDGMVVWNFAAWGGNPNLTRRWGKRKDGRIDPEPEIRAQIRCLRLMNAHLACLYRCSPNALDAPQVLTPEHFMKVRSSDCEWVGHLGDPGALAVALTRNRPGSAESRWRRHRMVVSAESIEAADALLRQLLDRESSEMALFRVESIYRSYVGYCGFDHGSALVNAWVAIEGLLGDLFGRYLQATHEQAGDIRIDSNRRRYLEGSSISSRTTAEMLSLAGYLPDSTYRRIRAAAKTRNSWMHDAAPDAMGSTQAEQAIRLAGEMFRLVEGIDIAPPVVRHLMSLG